MRSWMNKENSRYRAAVEEERQGHELVYPEALQDWMASAWLLYGVPFQYLVPSEAYLPKESIRFFWLDNNWLSSMLEGAVSAGGSSSADQSMQRRARSGVEKSTALHLYNPRLKKMHPNHMKKYQDHMKKNQDCRTTGEMQYMGFLLRSRMLETYSGMEVAGFDHEDERQLLRLSLLSDTVMIGIFDGPVTEVVLREPCEDLHFGFRTSDREIYIRCVEEKEGKKPGDKLSDEMYQVPVREGRMMEVSALADLFMEKLGVDEEHFTSAEFAMEMLMTADEARLCRKEET